mgnify:FL=1
MVAIATTQALQQSTSTGPFQFLRDITEGIGSGIQSATSTVTGWSDNFRKAVEPILGEINSIGTELQAGGKLLKAVGLRGPGEAIKDFGQEMSETSSSFQGKVKFVDDKVKATNRRIQNPTNNAKKKKMKRRGVQKTRRTSSRAGSFGKATKYRDVGGKDPNRR